ncbi:putative nitrate/sulfonate/bicarbonate ABC transporter ATP-binding protein [Gottschalkia acidurici 9a]|uniref:ABC-type quaternary amine transporter n=1 Tax=Gottschalkia acidurici (strain ATCC 7906 / DSM 604 / BCRC 14475 / CIP 104303 / KCTC 5404 / NCIMB 10678 / 9a) TaxID=1128398 RepID=K0B0X5_GOTA9|nr:ABC transporter ATP-binding protein [Gottschalkia acidurici]AFS79169.1 putative nitrate/sulfonate/bicarbonate ABC transporter ATP-binding protein [Gottschalkia acidurici 9a]
MVGEIQIKDISKVYESLDGEGEVNALKGINLHIKPGEFVSLVGASGCGKSTLLRLVTGLDTPTLGSLTIDGEEIKGPSHLRGLVFQDPTLYPWLTVRDNIALGLKARKIYNKDSEKEVDKIIDLIGLDGFQNTYPHHLSGGMAQRVSLARALINKPKVLLLDEPLGALDAFTRMDMQDEILRILDEHKTTMILVTHDVDEAIYLSDRIVIMTPRPGKIQEIIDVKIGRPRNRNHPDFIRIRSKILELLHFAKENHLSYYI